MIIIDSCGRLEWFTEGKPTDQYQKYPADQENILMPSIIVAAAKMHKCNRVSSDAYLKGQANVLYIPKQ